jgi:hypothetical protein
MIWGLNPKIDCFMVARFDTFKRKYVNKENDKSYGQLKREIVQNDMCNLK